MRIRVFMTHSFRSPLILQIAGKVRNLLRCVRFSELRHDQPIYFAVGGGVSVGGRGAVGVEGVCVGLGEAVAQPAMVRKRARMGDPNNLAWFISIFPFPSPLYLFGLGL
jgi:hypothetical protein